MRLLQIFLPLIAVSLVMSQAQANGICNEVASKTREIRIVEGKEFQSPTSRQTLSESLLSLLKMTTYTVNFESLTRDNEKDKEIRLALPLAGHYTVEMKYSIDTRFGDTAYTLQRIDLVTPEGKREKISDSPTVFNGTKLELKRGVFETDSLSQFAQTDLASLEIPVSLSGPLLKKFGLWLTRLSSFNVKEVRSANKASDLAPLYLKHRISRTREALVDRAGKLAAKAVLIGTLVASAGPLFGISILDLIPVKKTEQAPPVAVEMQTSSSRSEFTAIMNRQPQKAFGQEAYQTLVAQSSANETKMPQSQTLIFVGAGDGTQTTQYSSVVFEKTGVIILAHFDFKQDIVMTTVIERATNPNDFTLVRNVVNQISINTPVQQ